MAEIWRSLIYCAAGVMFGIVVAGGLFAFITTIGVVTRLAAGTKTAKNVELYETLVIFGVGIYNVIDLFRLPVPAGVLFNIVYGLFAGVFVGCLASALAEVVQVLPVFARRVHLKFGLPFVVLSFAIGKGIGAWYQLVCGFYEK